jgi:hypothetical protein
VDKPTPRAEEIDCFDFVRRTGTMHHDDLMNRENRNPRSGSNDDDLVGRSEWNTGQANVFGDDLEPATVSDDGRRF